jgi:hypothetical protein
MSFCVSRTPCCRQFAPHIMLLRYSGFCMFLPPQKVACGCLQAGMLVDTVRDGTSAVNIEVRSGFAAFLCCGSRQYGSMNCPSNCQVLLQSSVFHPAFPNFTVRHSDEFHLQLMDPSPFICQCLDGRRKCSQYMKTNCMSCDI